MDYLPLRKTRDPTHVPWWHNKWKDTRCPLCMGRIKPKNYVTLTCHIKHMMHIKCYQQYLTADNDPKCPFCRHPIA